jgi:CheY-like chemotaxis protein
MPTETLRFLVVEDDPVNRFALSELLRLHGHDAACARNGRDAVARFEAGESFDVILLDLRMPVLGGVETVRELRRLEAESGSPRAAVFVTSALVREAREREESAPYIDGFIDKPFSYDIIETVARAVRRLKTPTA